MGLSGTQGQDIQGVCDPYELYTGGWRAILPVLKLRITSHRTSSARTTTSLTASCSPPYYPVFISKFHGLTTDTSLIVTWSEVWNNCWYKYLGWKGVFGKI